VRQGGTELLNFRGDPIPEDPLLRHRYVKVGPYLFCPLCRISAKYDHRGVLVGLDEKGDVKGGMGVEVCVKRVALAVEGLALEFTEEQKKKWQAAYPNASPDGELPHMQLWLDNNPRRRPKSLSGLKRFASNWLRKSNGVGKTWQKKSWREKQASVKEPWKELDEEEMTAERWDFYLSEFMRSRRRGVKDATVLCERLHGPRPEK
jgi:hypothetical protein